LSLCRPQLPKHRARRRISTTICGADLFTVLDVTEHSRFRLTGRWSPAACLALSIAPPSSPQKDTRIGSPCVMNIVRACELAPFFFRAEDQKIMFNEVSEFCLVQGDGGLPTAVVVGEPRGAIVVGAPPSRPPNVGPPSGCRQRRSYHLPKTVNDAMV
jgi:hypothetical protein